ncbi:MAG: hypothetical protein ACYC8V_09945, partial [Caulobacteraceae bacterium]
AELRAEQADIGEAATRAVVAAFLRLAKAGETVASPGAIKEARLTLLEAHRLARVLRRQRNEDRGLGYTD